MHVNASRCSSYLPKIFELALFNNNSNEAARVSLSLEHIEARTRRLLVH